MDTANQKVTDLEGQNKTFLESVCKVLGLDASKTKPEDVPDKIKEATSSNNAIVEKAQEALRKSAFIAAAVKQGIRKEALEDAYKLADFTNVKADLETMSVFLVDKDGNQIKEKDKPVTAWIPWWKTWSKKSLGWLVRQAALAALPTLAVEGDLPMNRKALALSWVSSRKN